MKHLILLLSLLTLPFLSYSRQTLYQSGVSDQYAGNPENWNYRLRDRMNDLLSNIGKAGTETMDNIEGTQYFDENFSSGKLLFYKKESERELNLRYNAFRDEFEVKEENSDQIKYLMRRADIGVLWGGSKYVYLKYDPGKKEDEQYGYLREILEADDFVVFINQRKMYKEGKPSPNSLVGGWPAKFIDQEDFYFLDKSKNVAQLITKKDLQFLEGLSKSENDQIKKFMKSNKIDLKQAVDIVKLYTFYAEEIVAKS